MIRRFIIAALALCLLSPILSGSAGADPAAGETVRLPIVMYHEVKYFHQCKDTISPWELESDLKYLKENAYTAITMGDLIAWFYGGSTLPPKPIMLTFDDGYLSTYRYVLPLLEKYETKIVLNLIVKDTDDFTRAPCDNIDYSHVTWSQLNEMLVSGLVEVQNHSYGLHAVKNGRYGCIRKDGESPEAFEEALNNDLQEAQRLIFSKTGRVPSTFAYPFGRYNQETDDILQRLGFQATLSCRYGINTLSRLTSPDLFRLKRLCRAHGVPVGTLVDEAFRTRL